MTQSNLNQAGLEAAARALYGINPYVDSRYDIQTESMKDSYKQGAQAAISAYLECVEHNEVTLMPNNAFPAPNNCVGVSNGCVGEPTTGDSR